MMGQREELKGNMEEVNGRRKVGKERKEGKSKGKWKIK